MHKYGVYLVAIIALALYYPTLSYDYNLDDELVTRGLEYQERGLEVSHYTAYGTDSLSLVFSEPYYQDTMGNRYGFRPITHTSFALEHAFFGESASTSHAINVILYALLGVFMGFLIRKLFPEWNPALAWLVAILFVVHPMHAEVVASIKNRDEILALFFFVGGWLALIRLQSKPWLAIIVGLLFLALSIFSKLSLFMMTALILLYIYRGVSFSWFHALGYALGAILIVSLRMDYGYEIVIMLCCLSAIGLLALDWVSSKEARKRTKDLVNSLPSEYKRIREVFKESLNSISRDYAINSWSFYAALLLIALSFIDSQIGSVNFFFVSAAAVIILHLILRVRLPYYLYLGLLGGVALKVGLVSQFFMSLPILIGIARQVAKGNEQSSIQQIYRDFLPSIFLYTLVLGLLFFNASAFELSILIQFLYPFVAIPLVYYVQQVLSKLPGWFRWFVLCLGMLFLVSVLTNTQSNLMPLPVFIGVIFGCMPFDMPIRRRFSPLALGSSLLLVVVLWKVILPSDKPVTLHVGAEEEWVDSLELLDTVSIKNTVKEPSNLGRILHPSENPMVTGATSSDRLVFSLNNLTHYVGQMVLCRPWSAYYGLGALEKFTAFNAFTILGILISILLIGLFFYGWRASKPDLWLGAGIILFGLLPFINVFVLMAGGVADRYVFSASLGSLILIVYGIKTAAGKKTSILLICCLVYCVGLGYTSLHRMKAWKNKEVLYTSSLQQYPSSAKLNFLKGDYLFNAAMDRWITSDKSRKDFTLYRSSLDSALQLLNTAISLDSTVYQWLSKRNTLAEFVLSLDSVRERQAEAGLVEYSYITYLSQGQVQEAFKALEDYCFTDSINCIGHHKEFIQSALGVEQISASFDAFNLLIDKEPLEINFEVYTNALYPIAVEDTLAKRVLSETFEQGIERYPNSAKLQFNYGSFLMTYNDFSNALEAFNGALRINPNLEFLKERIAICKQNLQ